MVRDKVRLPELRTQLAQADVPALAAELGVGEFTLRDIIEALGRPERDPRDDLPKPIFKKGVLKLEDLTAGMELKGTVLNVVDFGAFVDIGLKDSGLVHISQLANRYVKSPHDVVSVGDVVTVWVMGVDQERKRVSLTMVKPGTERHRGPQSGGRRGGPGEPRDPNQREPAGRARAVAGPAAARAAPARLGADVAARRRPVGGRPGRDPVPPPRSRPRPGPRPRSGRSRRTSRGRGSRRPGTTWPRTRAGPPARAAPIAGPAATGRLVSTAIATAAPPRRDPQPGHTAQGPRLPHFPRMPWPAMSRCGPSASSSSSGKRRSKPRRPKIRSPRRILLGLPRIIRTPPRRRPRMRPNRPRLPEPDTDRPIRSKSFPYCDFGIDDRSVPRPCTRDRDDKLASMGLAC